MFPLSTSIIVCDDGTNRNGSHPGTTCQIQAGGSSLGILGQFCPSSFWLAREHAEFSLPLVDRRIGAVMKIRSLIYTHITSPHLSRYQVKFSKLNDMFPEASPLEKFEVDLTLRVDQGEGTQVRLGQDRLQLGVSRLVCDVVQIRLHDIGYGQVVRSEMKKKRSCGKLQ